MRRNNRAEIISLFVKMVEETSVARVRVADIINALGINRNTFYYHFASKYDVAMAVFREKLDEELRQNASERELICAPLSSKSPDEKPLAYYVHAETGARTLDCSVFMRCLVKCALSNPCFYRKLFNRQELDFERRLKDLYLPVFRSDIVFILGGRYMPEPTLNMLTTASMNCMLSMVELCLRDKQGAALLDERVNPFWNILHESLYAAIQAHPINRYSSKG